MNGEREGFDPSEGAGGGEKEKPAELKARIGPEVMKRYLAVSDGDSKKVREIKEKVAGLSLDDAIEALVDRGRAGDVVDAMKTLGISRVKRETSGKNKKMIDRWVLKNPDPAAKVGDPYANTEHLKAFIAGFVEGENDAERMKVLVDLCTYLDIPAPKIEEVMIAVQEVVAAGATMQEVLASEAVLAAEPESGEVEPKSPTRFGSFDRLKKRIAIVFLALSASLLPGEGARGGSAVVDEQASADIAMDGAERNRQAEVGGAGELGEKLYADTYVMKEGDNPEKIITILAAERGLQLDQQQVTELTNILLGPNAISAHEGPYDTAGDTLDHTDTHKLLIGRPIDLKKVNDRLAEFEQAAKQ